MAVRVTDALTGKAKGTTFTDRDVGRIVKRTSPIKGSVLRKTTGMDTMLKVQGRRPTREARREVMGNVKAGKGGFTVMGGAAGGRSK